MNIEIVAWTISCVFQMRAKSCLIYFLTVATMAGWNLPECSSILLWNAVKSQCPSVLSCFDLTVTRLQPGLWNSACLEKLMPTSNKFHGTNVELGKYPWNHADHLSLINIVMPTLNKESKEQLPNAPSLPTYFARQCLQWSLADHFTCLWMMFMLLSISGCCNCTRASASTQRSSDYTDSLLCLRPRVNHRTIQYIHI